MKTKKQYFTPYYNEQGQVINCAASMLGCKISSAIVTISVGYTASGFITSADWLMEIEGRKAVLPFCIQPQSESFITVTAGVSYSVWGDDNLEAICDPKGQEKNTVLVMPTGEEFVFEPGQKIRICVATGAKFLGTDCDVELIETDTTRFLRVKVDEESTKYALLEGTMVQAAR